MERGFAKDFDYVQLLSSPSDQNDRTISCGQRSVKRKYDAVCLDGSQGTAFFKTEGWKSSCSSEVAEVAVPSKGYENTFCNPREVSMLTRDMEFENGLNERYTRWPSCSEMHVPIPHRQELSLQADEENLELFSSMVNDQDVLKPAFERHGKAESIGRTAFPTRRVALETFRREPETFNEVNRVQDTASQSDVSQLREALESQKKALHTLYMELEEERCASATAANEAMAMITRLQEEKAAAIMEARQYRLVAEQREAYQQDALAFLRESILSKENDLLALQDQIEAYTNFFNSTESGTQGCGRCQDYLLEEGFGKQSFLFPDGKEATSSSSLCVPQCGEGRLQDQVVKIGNTMLNQLGAEREFKSQNQKLSSPKRSDLLKLAATDGLRLNLPIFYDDIRGGYLDHATEECSVEGWTTEEGTLVNSPKNNRPCGEGRYCEGERFEAAEIIDLAGVNTQEQNLEETTMSILTRVKRLEEHLQYFGRTQTPENQRFCLDAYSLRNDDVVTGDLSTENVASTSWNLTADKRYKWQLYAEEMQENRMSSTSDRLVKNWGNGFRRERSLVPNGEAGAEAEVSESKNYRPDMHKSPPRQEDGSRGDPGEGVHDVFEVHYETDESFVCHSEYGARDLGQCMNQLEENKDALFSSTLEESARDYAEVISARTSKDALAQGDHKACRPGINEKIFLEINSLEAKDVLTGMADEEVHQLKLRLQALEGERVFTKQAIESLRKENMELKLLQEIAQRLRELKMGTQKTNQPKGMFQQDHLSFFSFFKGILSFTGLQSSVHTEGSRFVCPFQTSSETSNKQNHGGLVHLLEKHVQSRKIACVTRGLKVKLPAAGETGHLYT